MKPGKVGDGLYQPLAEINVTPVVDVMLVLLIIFMVTAPMLATGIKVNLPSAKTAQPLENKQPVVVSVTKDGAVSVGKDSVSRDELAATVKARLGDSNGVVQLRGDRDAAYGDVVSVMDELAANGVTRIAIVSSRARLPIGRLPRSRRRSHDRRDPQGRIFEPRSVNPPWLRPLVVAIVIALHVAALSIVYSGAGAVRDAERSHRRRPNRSALARGAEGAGSCSFACSRTPRRRRRRKSPSRSRRRRPQKSCRPAPPVGDRRPRRRHPSPRRRRRRRSNAAPSPERAAARRREASTAARAHPRRLSPKLRRPSPRRPSPKRRRPKLRRRRRRRSSSSRQSLPRQGLRHGPSSRQSRR